jgi:N-acetylglucosamine malate deacetylase 1
VQVDIKVRAVGCYESQAHRVYSDPDYLRAQMRFRGTQIGVRYAEAFDVVRWVFAN